MKRYYIKRRKAKVNDIGIPGGIGFGVGICPLGLLASYNSANPTEPINPMSGYDDPASENYGNYKVGHDGSIIVWNPFGWAKKNADNTGDVKPEWYFTDETAANAAGYFLPRVFINGGAVQRGVFIDKYKPSLTGVTAAELDSSGSLANKGIASSIKLGNPIGSAADTLRKLVTGSDNLYAGCFANCRFNSKTPTNTLGGGIDAIKSRGASYHVMTAFAGEWIRFIQKIHQQAAVGTTLCAWNGITPAEPRGNNNYGVDYYDTGVTYQACDDQYWGTRTPPMEARKSGGGIPFNKTTHNGQNCGICIDANQWEFLLGISSLAEAAQNIVSITREAEAVFTITNAAATNSNYANGKPVQIAGTKTGEWATLLKNIIFTISDLSGNTFKLKNKTGAYVNTSALTADYDTGLTTITGKFYVLKESVDVKNITSGTSGATDHWGATGLAAMFDEIDIDMCGAFAMQLGNGSNQVFSGETDRTNAAYKLSQAGIPMNKDAYSAAGSAVFGYDYNYINIVSNVALLGFGGWNDTSHAGPGARAWTNYRTNTNRYNSVRGGLFIG